MYNRLDMINNEIANLERMKTQLPQQPPIMQNFQFNQPGIKYANNIDEVDKEMVFVDTPFGYVNVNVGKGKKYMVCF